MCFDFRRARSHPLGPTITSRLPGRFAMYTPKEVHVKVADLPDEGYNYFRITAGSFLLVFAITDWWLRRRLNRAAPRKHRRNEIPRRGCSDRVNRKRVPKYVGSVVDVPLDQYAPK